MQDNDCSRPIRVYYCRNAAQLDQMPAALAELDLSDRVALEPVPCSGRIDPRYLLKAFESGTEAVCVVTCPKDECKRMEGNLRATSRVRAVRELLAEAGLDPNGLQIFTPGTPEEDPFDGVLDAVRQFAGNGRQSRSVAA